MTFAQPLWLAAAVPVCLLLAWLYRRQDASQRAALAKFAAARLLPKLTSSISVHRRWLKRGLVMAGIALTFAALARPQWGEEWRDTHRRGLEIVFAMDTSKSMLAQDVKPNRLQRSKLAVTDLIARLKGDGVGLIAFAGDAFLQCPVTLDYNAFRESLEALDTSTIERGGTDIAAAIREAQAVFEDRTAAEKILVLITDGEDLDGEGITAAETASKKGVRIFTVGVGNATGELVPVPNGRGGTEFARDETGQLVKSKLDESTLRKIADATGGMYQPLGSTTEGLNTIYDQGFSKLTRGDLSSRQARVPLERFQWPLAAALLCFAGEWLIGNRRRNPVTAQPPPLPAVRKRLPSPPSSSTTTPNHPAAGTAATAAAGVLIALLGMAAAPSAQAAVTPQSAEQAYHKGDYAKAREEYASTASASAASHPEKSAPLHFNTGSAAYKSGDFAQAAASFQETLKNAPVSVQQDAYYNLGNTQFRLGQQSLKDKPEDTLKTWEEAVKSYDAALQINPSDPSAKHNRDLVKRKIEDLKKQQEQQKNQDQNQQDKDKDQKDDNQDQKDQNKDSKDQQNKDGQDQKQDSKDQQSKDGQDQKQDAKDQQSKDGKDQKQDAKDQQGKDGKDQKQDAKDQQSKDSKDQQQSDDKKDGQKDDKSQPQPVNDSPKPQQGEIKAADPASEQKAAEAAADRVRAAPGQMTREEARQLLDALRNEERRVPSISAQGRAGSQPAPGKKIKDW